MSQVLHPPLPATADKLLAVWNGNWNELGEKQENVDLIIGEIDNMRNETLLLLEALDNICVIYHWF